MTVSEWFQGKPSPYDRLFALISSIIGPIGGVITTGLRKDPAQLNASAISLGNNFANVGAAIDCRWYNGVAVYGQFTKGDAAQAVEFRWLLQYDAGGTLQPVEPKYAADQETRSDRTHYEPLPVGATKDFYIEMPLTNRIPYMQLQARCPAATTCQINADAQYTLGY